MSDLRYFGIRHHGPGCARSLLRAFEQWKPDCVLVEGPAEAETLLPTILSVEMEPPVALLGYSVEHSALASFFPFAEFSPEWQALRWALQNNAAARFIDLPLANSLALEHAQRGLRKLSDTDSPVPTEAREQDGGEVPDDNAAATAVDPPEASAQPSIDHSDPLDWLARAAGYDDGEGWWNHMVEERGDGTELFAAIAEAMSAVRAELGDRHRDAHDAAVEIAREAQMRQGVRDALKAGHQRIAVVCGAWHVPALLSSVTQRADQAVLKPLPKLKVQCTWVPWTNANLTRASGYGAGIAAPGWYEHLWRSEHDADLRATGWLARIGRLLRERDLDCSSAHLIEATRLAHTLAALRQRPAPGLAELHEAARSVLTLGDGSALRFIDAELTVGQRLGRVPSDVPTVPLQRDLNQSQKSLRLKPEAVQKVLDLDLRTANDLARSQLLHRLNLLGVRWGEVERVGRSARGTFHEIWRLQWQPEYELRLIENARLGQTVLEAATAAVAEQCRLATQLPVLAELVDRALLADLPAAVAATTQALDNLAAVNGDALQLLRALPPLANSFRYGNVRQTDAGMVAHVLDGLIVRASIGLPFAAGGIDEAAANTLREAILAAHAAVQLRADDQASAHWHSALALLGQRDTAHDLLRGLVTRLLLDSGLSDHEDAAIALGLALSSGAEPAAAAAWLDGFLNRNAAVLLHDAVVFKLVDDWLSRLPEPLFVNVLPLVRRCFSSFAAGERRDLAARASAGASATLALDPPGWNPVRAALPVPLLRQILGVAA